MRTELLCSVLSLCAVAPTASAQTPDYEKKAALPTTLLSLQSYLGNSAQVSKLTTPVPGDSYTLEVKGKIISGTGRGLDICVNDASGQGFRVSLDAKSLNWTYPLTQAKLLVSADNTKLRTLRFAVADKQVSIYQDGYFVATCPLEEIEESITRGFGENVNPEVIPSESWGSSKPTPISKGWYLLDGSNKEVSSWPKSRFETSPSLKASYEDGSVYNGNFFLIRWDGGLKNQSYKYAYAVKGLKANATYQLSMDCAYWNNDNSTTFTLGVSQEKTLGNPLKTYGVKTKGKSGKQILVPNSMTFTTNEEGTYYVYMTGTEALFAIANLQLKEVKKEVAPMILIGKNYEGEGSMEVESATYDATGAFAPAATTGERSSLTFSDAGTVEQGQLFNSDVTVSGKTNLHLTADGTPFSDVTFNLQGEDAWLYIDYVKPSKVIANYLNQVKINGQTAESEKNCRITMWANGTVIIPNGQAYDSKALVAYDGENFTGNSKEFEIDTYHNNLGEWDNKIRSFKLKKGYMATLANNANGTGYSRVFNADDADMEVSVLPEGMENFVSFVRVFRWNWASKKGKASGYGDKDRLNITSFYDWNVGGKSDDPDIEYSPIRQNLGWPSWNDINNKKGVTHLLGCNEPDRPDQAKATVDQVIAMWPEMLKSGLRLGSPAPSSVWTWVGDFFNKIELFGYRCDFAVAHIYENSLNASSLVSRINTLSEKGKGRPVWITEWNNGANWTNEWWPTAKGPKCDANSNPILDEDGNTTEVNRPLSAENAEKNRKFFAEALPALDKCNLIERYFEYDWVQDCRALVLNGELTPAGKVYANHKAALAYHEIANKSWENWKICPPFMQLSIDKDYRNIQLKWYDHNGETGKKYILERKLDDAADFTAYKEFVLGKDYQAGETVTFSEAIPCTSTVAYRIKALSYKDTESATYEQTFTRDAAIAAPVLKGEAASTSVVNLSWDAVSDAKGYRIERADSEDGEYKVIADNLTTTSYQDTDLKTNTTYYYRAYSLNSAAERPASQVFAVKTKSFAKPEDMTGLRISAGANSASIRWQFAYDTFYKVLRSDKENGTYTVVTDKVDGTSYIDEGLTNGSTYYYKVLPYNEAGEGNVSSILKATPEAGKYLHLAFDENEGTVTYDEWGAYDGTFLQNASFVEGRNGGYAAKLVKNSKSYVELPKGAVSRLYDFTIATWIKIPGGKGRIFDFGSGTGVFMIAAANSTGLKYKITCEKGAFDFTVPCKWTTTDWHHLVITQKGKDMAVYFDGEEVGTAVNEKEIYPKDMGVTTQNWLGRSQWAQDAYCDHVYDDFRIYNYAIEASDVTTLYEDKEILTGITLLEDRSNGVRSEAIYDLQGRKVSHPVKGIYIQKGKKFVVK